MKILIEDFGTDHWYQLDGYFNGGTAPWLADRADATTAPGDAGWFDATELAGDGEPKQRAQCIWGNLTKDAYSPCCTRSSCYADCKSYNSVATAKAACVADEHCAAITGGGSRWELRAGASLIKSPNQGEESYLIINAKACGRVSPPPPPPPPPPLPVADDPSWTARGAAAYRGLNRTDPEAIWSFQGWAFVGWNSDEQRNSLKSFIDATPKGKFNIVDMSVNGDGEWKKWKNGTGLWGPDDNGQFIWSTLHDFVSTDGLKGWIGRINHIPFDAVEAGARVPLSRLLSARHHI